jgi:hypothetical protein
VAAYALHGAITQTGVAGWLIYFQDTLLGGYYTLVSFLLTWVLFAVPAMVAWSRFANMVSRGSDTGFTERLLFRGFGRREGEPPRVTTNRQMLIACAVLVVVTWAIGFAIYAWWAHGKREDATATYEPVTVTDGIAVPSLKGKHLSLVGDLRTDRALEDSYGGSLLPVVSRGWKLGMPVTFILKVERPSDLPGRRRPQPYNPAKPVRPEPVLARVGGDVPVPATQYFKKMGVPLSERSYLLRLVPSEGGKPVFGDSSDAGLDNLLAERFTWALYGCAGVSVLWMVFLPLAVWSERRTRKRASTME